MYYDMLLESFLLNLKTYLEVSTKIEFLFKN